MDIKKYKFKDADIDLIEAPHTLHVDDVICFGKANTEYIYLTKDDVIALAQHYNVTEYDLSC